MPAACALTQGHQIPCRDIAGGVDTFYIAALEDKDVITTTSGQITAFTMDSGKKFWVYNVDAEDGEAFETENNSPETGSVFYEQNAVFSLKQLTSSARNELRLLVQNRLMIIVKDNAGKFWLYGESKGALKTGTNDARTGKAMADLNGYNLSFIAKETLPAKEVDSSLISSLTSA